MAIVFETLEDIQITPPPNGMHVAVGTFDGIHVAHARLLGRVAGEAHATNGKAMVFTFQNHPRSVLNPEACPKILTPWPSKKELLKKLPIDYVVGIEFNSQFASMPAEDFVKHILVDRCHAKTIHSGKNFRFGKGGFGGPGLLEEYSKSLGYRYEQLEMMMQEDRRISSTRIREHLEKCEIKTVTKLLNHFHQISAPVIPGDQIGRTIGFPTANLKIDPLIALPGKGVYAGQTIIDGKTIPSMANYGNRPTVNGIEERFEIHLINWEGDLTNQEITFQFLDHIRPEIKFNGLDELKAQLAKDRKQALETFRNHR